MRKLFVALTLLLVLLLPGCFLLPNEYHYYHPSGIVYGPNNEPMGGATIEFGDGDTTTSNAYGEFTKPKVITYTCTAKPVLSGMNFTPKDLFFSPEYKTTEIHAYNDDKTRPSTSFSIESSGLTYTYNYADKTFSYLWELNIKNNGGGFNEIKVLIDRWDSESGPPKQDVLLAKTGIAPGFSRPYRGKFAGADVLLNRIVFIAYTLDDDELCRATVFPR